MAYNPPTKAAAFTTYVALDSATDVGRLFTGTLASGDVKVKKDTGAPANITTLPAVDAAGEYVFKVALTSTEMTADNVCVIFHDQTDPPEWADKVLTIVTTA